MHKLWPIFLREQHLRLRAQFDVLKALTDEIEAIDNETPTWSAISYINIALAEKGVPFQYLEIQQPGKYFLEVQQTKIKTDEGFEEWCQKFEEWSTARADWSMEIKKK